MKNASLPFLLILTLITGGIFGVVYQKYGRTSNANRTTNQANLNTVTNTVVSDAYPSDVIDSYLVKYGGYEPTPGQMTYSAVHLTSQVATPFKRDEYNGTITPYGVLFWKKGPTKQATIKSFGTTPIEYEAGISPDFRWYDFRTKKFTTLPSVKWNVGVEKFDRVYEVHVSITEPKVLVEVGEYDSSSSSFEPGLVDSQPMKTRGMIFNPRTTSFEVGDPITAFSAAIKSTSTLFYGFRWDSQNQVGVSVPGGEGCGPSDSISFVNLKTRVVTRYGGEGKLGFTKDTCNPRNSISVDGKWVILYGSTSSTEGQAILYSVIGTKKVKLVKTRSFGIDEYVSKWDTTKELPSITTVKNLVIDFNI